MSINTITTIIVCIILGLILFNIILNWPRYKQDKLNKRFYNIIDSKSEHVLNAYEISDNEYYLKLENITMAPDIYLDWSCGEVEILSKPSKINSYYFSIIKVFLSVTTGKKFKINYIKID